MFILLHCFFHFFFHTLLGIPDLFISLPETAEQHGETKTTCQPEDIQKNPPEDIPKDSGEKVNIFRHIFRLEIISCHGHEIPVIYNLTS